MQNQWDDLLRHIMGITAAMEVWEPSTASSSGGGGNGTGENSVNTLEVEGKRGNQNDKLNMVKKMPPSLMRTSAVRKKELLGGQDSPAQCGGDSVAPLDENYEGK